MTSEWSLASGYGLFASMTGVDRDTGDVARPELSIESCDAGFDGPQEYEFKYKPTAINRSLPVVSFPRMGQLMPRLDWQMWCKVVTLFSICSLSVSANPQSITRVQFKLFIQRGRRARGSRESCRESAKALGPLSI